MIKPEVILIAGKITENCFLKSYHRNEVKFLKKEKKNETLMKKANELVGVMKHYLVEPISSLTYVKGDLGYTSLNTITAEEEIELRFHSRFLIGVALMIRYVLLLGYVILFDTAGYTSRDISKQSFLQLNILDNLIV
ncbi:hypothetical protein T01_14456 [Trichinella spiralis]|uniref:Uncharacterized protein n=1 Tax=Trichinella spiralis TaxID=6334 RepID=A0A0V1BGZ6_TRISP|nr:hypothetical protein T01_14456 [Trichinella spiralis]